MQWKRRINGLFGKAILALGLVSIVPVLLIGWYVLHTEAQILQREVSEKQHTIAHRIAYAVSEEIARHIQFFSTFVGLHANFDEHPALNKNDLNYLLSQNPHISYLSVLNNKGKSLFSAGETTQSSSKNLDIATILSVCAEQKNVYIGSVQREETHLYEFMAFPIPENKKNGGMQQVLVAGINLDSLATILQGEDFPNMLVVVLSRMGSLMATSDNTLNFSKEVREKFIKQLDVIMQSPDAPITQDIMQKDVLISRAHVPLLDWNVFVLQPANTAYTLLKETLFHSFSDVLIILLAMVVFIFAVGYWVLTPIVRPVKRLHDVAVKFERRDDYMPTESDLIIPNNEIGEFARVFLHMARVLGERKATILATQQRLQSINAELEQRVQQRTQELNQAMEDLVKAERLSTIGQMASIISHEIRNPLAVISNATRLIKTVHPPKEPKLIKQFAIIEEEIQQANHIIGEVLGFARSRDMILSVIDLNQYLRELLVAFPLPVNVNLETEIDKNTANLKVDVEELKQAIRNLLSNAAESMPQGGTVSLGSRVGKKAVGIYVADEGPGINDEVKAKIFDPFYTTKARGTGLGLAVVRKAIFRHHGKLFIYNRKPKGSVFAIYLPIYRKTGEIHNGTAS